MYNFGNQICLYYLQKYFFLCRLVQGDKDTFKKTVNSDYFSFMN